MVILPAFGASVQEMQLLKDKGCTIVDTTCPWFPKSGIRSRSTKRRLYSLFTYNHEETIATSSFAAKYLVVLNLAEAEYVADYILNGGDRNEFMAKFSRACSDGLDPDLEQIGIANQTTMLRAKPSRLASCLSALWGSMVQPN